MEGGTTDDEKLFPRFIKGLMVLFPHHNLVSKTEVKVRNWLLFNFFFKTRKKLNRQMVSHIIFPRKYV